jgi:hypothetical protein
MTDSLIAYINGEFYDDSQDLAKDPENQLGEKGRKHAVADPFSNSRFFGWQRWLRKVVRNLIHVPKFGEF